MDGHVGVAHTVAIPRPAEHVAKKLRVRLRRRRAELDDAFRAALEDRAIADFAAVSGQFSRRELRDQQLPDGIVIGKGCTDDEPIRDAVTRAIERIPVQWRLDVVLVLGDLLDGWDD